jgi:hypothetical protein
LILKSGFTGKKFAAAVLATGLLLAFPEWLPAADLPVTGNLVGSVVNAAGAPQMGASVQVFNRLEKLVARAISLPDGRFSFAGLPVDTYSVRVSLVSFLPAFRDQIAVKAGLDSVLQIHLATLFSDIELHYTAPSAAMSEDWKWVLRSSPATRPINRALSPEEAEIAANAGADAEDDPLPAAPRPKIFSGTHAMLSLSGGDGGLIDTDSTQGGDLGTGFALSTNLLGKNQLQFAGTYGQGGGLAPSAVGICAIYSRNADGGLGKPPEVTLTVLQLDRFGSQSSAGSFPGQNNVGSALPPLRTMSLSVYEVADIAGSVHLEYGLTGESVDYMQHSSRISPFARATLDLGADGAVIAAYNDGGRPDELTAHQQYDAGELDRSPSDDLTSAVNALARLPQVSNRNGRLELQRTQDYELGYRKKAGSRTYSFSAFYERVSNGRLNVSGSLSSLDPDDLLYDGVSNTSTYNIGRYTRRGYLASVDQQVNDIFDVSMAFGRLGGFTPDAGGLGASGGVDQHFLVAGDHSVANINVDAKTRRAGTRLSAGYGWVDRGAVVPRHVFTTQNTSVAPGLNFMIRQPLPSLFGVPGHMELTADVRNLLSSGYIPVGGNDAQRLLIVQSPRSFRGGLNFTF